MHRNVLIYFSSQANGRDILPKWRCKSRTGSGTESRKRDPVQGKRWTWWKGTSQDCPCASGTEGNCSWQTPHTTGCVQLGGRELQGATTPCVPRGIKLHLPTTGPCFIISHLLPPVRLFFSNRVSWNHLPNQPLALKSLRYGLIVEEPKLK